MICRFWLPFAGALLLAACSSRPSTPDGAVLFDEDVALVRGAIVDSAQREIEVDGDSVIVAFVDEQLTDVTLKLSVIDSDGKTPAPEVENKLRGAGVEIAALATSRTSRIRVTLTSEQESMTPGRVHLRLRRFDSDSKSSKFAAQLAAFKAWSAATNASFRVDAVTATGLPDMDRAIASLNSAQGDAALAAQARLVKTKMLYFFHVDWREARAEAQRAATAFRALPTPDRLGEARANFGEALALMKISIDRKSVDPTPEEAVKLARESLTALSAPDSVFGPIERAGAIGALGQLDFAAAMLDDAEKRFEEARTIYLAAGYRAGEREMRCNLATVPLERGQWRDAALAFEALLPELDKISNPELRAMMYLGAARGESFSGRTDQAAENQLKALALAREYKLRTQEASALHGLAHVYENRGDTLQARAFFAEVLRLTREDTDVMEYVWALASAGAVARGDGDFEQAIEMHKEAVSRAANPIGSVRTLRELGQDYFFARDYPAAIVEFRKSLAVDLHDPTHHAYSDVKRNLAQALIENEERTPATFKEAARLLDESLKSSLRVGDKQGVLGAHRVNAQLLAEQHKTAEALAEYEVTFKLADEYRVNSASSEARRATQTHVQAAIRGYLDLVMSAVAARGAGKLLPASKAEEAALRKLEAAREANFGATRIAELDAETTARVDALFAQMATKSLKIAALLKRNLSAEESAELNGLQSEMSDLHAELDRVRTAAAAKTAVVDMTRPIMAREWRKLAPGVVQLSYALGREHAYVWARSATGVLTSVLPVAPQNLERELIEIGALDRQAAPEQVERALERLSATLLPAGLLPVKSTAVEIVAEGRIAGVPFPALRSPSDRKRRLVETHSITMITSLFAGDEPPRLKHARPFRLVALASGNGTLRSAAVMDPTPKLQAATKEIRTVANLFVASDNSAKVKLLLGAEGSAATLRSLWGSGADVVHFATHALADLRQPLASLLVLPATDAGGAPTYLTAGQVEGWRGDIELVFLSACESAIGPPRFAGGMPGLQGAFLRAGARGVIATLWPIEDVLAQEFSEDFYRRFTSGETAADALSETQRAWLAPKPGASEAEQMRRRITALAHGFYTQ
jgi:CHAT domain-containing protein